MNGYFSNLKIRTRLIFLVGFFLLLMSANTGIMYLNSKELRFSFESQHHDHLIPVSIISRIQFLIGENRTHASLITMHEPLTSIEKKQGHDVSIHYVEIEKNREEINQLEVDYLKHDLLPEEKILFTEWKSARRTFLSEGLDPMLEAVKKGDFDLGIAIFLEKVNPLYKEVAKRGVYLQDQLVKWGKEELYEAEKSDSQYQFWGLILLSFTAVFSIGISAVLIHSIISQVKTIDDCLEHLIKTRDFTVRLNVNTTEIGCVSSKLMKFIEIMKDTLLDVKTNTHSVTTASREIAEGNMDLSSRTEQQASSLEETAAAMEELTSTVRQNADSAKEGNNLTTKASIIAKKGGLAVNLVVDTMVLINESSKKIVEIISVIEGIAFQTNILALNAAVEAARAGNQGKGFAVVAIEVRSLAQRSTNAAKEIKDLITTSVSNVEMGSQQAADAGKTMNDIVVAVNQVTQIMSEISHASEEQARGIEQVNIAISQMDIVTQQNAALVEEAAAAAGSLEQQSVNLKQLISLFRVSGSKFGYVLKSIYVYTHFVYGI